MNLPLADPNPTGHTYSSFDRAFAHFNAALFDGKLPHALIALQRKKDARGYYGHDRLEFPRGNKHRTPEIALNPAAFGDRTDREIASTLLHEMVHLEQYSFGTPSRSGYHNREWSAWMQRVGLMPSDTGEPGGKQVGQHMTHFILEDGPFAREWKTLEAAGFVLDYQDVDANSAASRRAAAKQKVKYSCPECDINAWGKPELRLFCAGQDGDPHPLGEMEALSVQAAQTPKASKATAAAFAAALAQARAKVRRVQRRVNGKRLRKARLKRAAAASA